jgi:hypothetical protein
MADINVERAGPSIWPWIIGLVVLALLIWAVAEMVGTRDRTGTVAPATQEVAPAATDPAAGTWVDPAPGTTDPATGAPASGGIDPATGEPAPRTMDPAAGTPGTTPATETVGATGATRPGTADQSPPRP